MHEQRLAAEDDQAVALRVVSVQCENSGEAEELLDRPHGEDGLSVYERVRQALPPDTAAELHVDRHGLWLRWPVVCLARHWLLATLTVLALLSSVFIMLVLYVTRS